MRAAACVGPSAAIASANALILQLSREGRLEAARDVFDRMPLRSVMTWNTLISAYFRQALPSEALRLFHLMPARTTESWNAVISGFALLGIPSSARSFFHLMPPSARNTISHTALLRALSPHPDLLPEAESLFRSIPSPNHISCTVMLSAYCTAGRLDAARALFDSMPHKDVVASTALLSGYCLAGRLDDARALFDSMPSRNAVSWTTMISGYARNSRLHLARKLFEVMPSRNIVSWTAMLTGYLQAGRHQDALDLFHSMPAKPPATCNAVILGLGRIDRVAEARAIFNGMPNRDLESYTTMMKVYGLNGLEFAALEVFREMQLSKFLGIPESVTGVLSICANLATIEHGRQVHSSVVRTSSLSFDVILNSALITMYVRCGDLVHAKRVFDAFPTKNVVMWNSMITGFAQHGMGEEALSLFHDMHLVDMAPNDVTFIGLLSACSYTGKVEEGKRIFGSMAAEYSVQPGKGHYACMVDLLGRAGHLEEALELIRGMTVEPDMVVWGSLLGACKMHSNIEVAEIAAEKLTLLEPTNSGPYVLLSNLYASKGRWDDVSKLRKLMKERNVSKFPGYSWIEQERKVHMFMGGDDATHPEHKSIVAMLNKLDGLLAEAGYFPDGSYVLHDVDEEQKVHSLRYHSERHAVAFGLLKVPEGMPIRVMKNLRVCGDCHAAIKLIAKVTGREIILRDANRFHHFKDGLCSCRDYW